MMTAAEIATIAGSGDSSKSSTDGADSKEGGSDSAESAESKSEVAAAAEMLMHMLQENVVQQFITDGLLVDGHKFDFAVYCYIDSFAPTLVAYTLENVRHEYLSACSPLSRYFLSIDGSVPPWSVLPVFRWHDSVT